MTAKPAQQPEVSPIVFAEVPLGQVPEGYAAGEPRKIRFNDEDVPMQVEIFHLLGCPFIRTGAPWRDAGEQIENRL